LKKSTTSFGYENTPKQKKKCFACSERDVDNGGLGFHVEEIFDASRQGCP